MTVTYILFDRWEMINSIKNKKKYLFNSYNFNKSILIPNSFRDVKFLNKEFNQMILSLNLDYTNQKTKKKLIKIKEHPNYSINKKKILDKILSKFFLYYLYSLKIKLF